MEKIELDGRIGLTLPDGFHVMQEDEKRKLRLVAEGEYAAFADPARHITATVGWRDIGLVSALLVSSSVAAQSAQKQIAAAMREYRYELSGFLQRDIRGRKAGGFRYTYEAGGSGMSGETFALKYGKRMYYFNVYYRTVLASESRKTWEEILDSVSDLK